MALNIHNQDKYFENKLKKVKQDKKLSEKNKELILRYLRDSSLGKTVRKGQKKEISAGRNLQAAGILNLMAKEWFKKDLDKVSQTDMERFILKLNKGQITTKYKKPYSSETKANIKKFIRKFYKWLLGDNRHYPELVEWIDTSFQEKEVKAIKGLDKGVKKIVELIPDIRRKALVWCCFDSGFREGEILSCRIKDVEKRADGIYYITCQSSKTKLRTVSLPLSSELLDRWLQEHPFKDDPDADLWQTSRVMLYKTVKLYGMKALKENITVHMLRHTSASYYASRLDRATFCKRFGWSYSSPTPDRYIDFAKVTENKVVDTIKAEKYNEMKSQLDDVKLQNALLQEQFEEFKKSIKKEFKEAYKTKIREKIKGQSK